MSGWSLSRLYQPLGGIGAPKFVAGSSLAFLGCLACDRLVFLEPTKTWKIYYLSSFGLIFVHLVGHPLTFATIAIPTALVLAERLLASGGANLFLAIGFAAKLASDEFHKMKGRSFAQWKSETLFGRNKNWSRDIPVFIHQVACWYFVPRAGWVWEVGKRFLGMNKSRWMYATGAFIGLGVWSSSKFWMPLLKVFYPHLHTQLVEYLQERPLCFIYSVRKFLRNRFDRLFFNAVSGKCPLYRYRPLEKAKSEIRLLKLHGANSWNIVKADLISVPISEAPPFEAISYRWSLGNKVSILLDGQKFEVSGEVHEMLRSLRFRLEDRLLWLDSICIDQKNFDEKSWQIEFMTQIYSSSKQVIGWIAAIGKMPLLPGPLSWLTKLGALSESPEEFVQSLFFGDLCIQLRASMISLCNEFFFRTWIIQETALARRLILKFGNEEIVWKEFFNAVNSFDKLHAMHGSVANLSAIYHSRMNQGAENIRCIEHFRIARKNMPDGLPLSELLLASIDFKATDPRDRIFGLLGLSTDSARQAIRISYTTDATDITVSVCAVKFTLVDELSFLLLELGGIGYLPPDVTDKFDGPSWIPWWSFAHTSLLKVHASTYNKLYKTATWASPVIVDGQDTSSVLQIQGIYIDKIQLLSDAWWPVDRIVNANYTTIEQLCYVFSELLDAIEGALRMVQHAHHPTYNDIDRQSLLWRTICHESRKGLNVEDQSFDEDGKQVEKSVRNVLQQLRGLVKRGETGMDVLNELRFANGILALSPIFPMQGQKLCITDNGYFGIVPSYAEEGDQILAFSGASNPFVLRPLLTSAISNETKTHQLVGVCYVDGIMHGELEKAGLERIMINLV